uniref:Uncharacterized protein n=1 Tax=Avena sativa TaxID=4498 RepID=A0ACD5XBD9_AVESA
MNIDASFHVDGSGAAGVVLRNSCGEALAGMACPMKNIIDSTSVEAMALLKGLKLLENLGCEKVTIESDSFELIQTCNRFDKIWSPYAAIMAECFLKVRFMKEIFFKHRSMEANQVAHNLSRFSYEQKSTVHWDDDFPSFLLSSILNDVTIV